MKNWFKKTLFVAGLAIAGSAANTAVNSAAFAGTIPNTDRVSFNVGHVTLDASHGPASTTFNPATKPNTVIDGQVQIDATHIDYWWKRRPHQSSKAARTEQANSWNFTLSHAGQTADLGGLPGAVNDHWFKTDAFDGVTAGGDWVLTATSDYYASHKRMIAFDLAGFFHTKAAPTSSSGGGSVPVPASALFILMGLAGIGAASRRKKAKA